MFYRSMLSLGCPHT